MTTSMTLSSRTSRSCVTCHCPLPKRAYRKQCASCIKLERGEHRVRTIITDSMGKRRYVYSWLPAQRAKRQTAGGDAA